MQIKLERKALGTRLDLHIIHFLTSHRTIMYQLMQIRHHLHVVIGLIRVTYPIVKTDLIHKLSSCTLIGVQVLTRTYSGLSVDLDYLAKRNGEEEK